MTKQNGRGVIGQEIQEFLTETGIRKVDLSRVAGVPQSTISHLVHSVRRNVYGPTQDKLRAAMRILRATNGKE